MPELAAKRDGPRADRKVSMGELDVLHTSGVLRTLLGSCIGLVLHDPQRCVGGLAHIVLPSANGTTDSPGKYADTAVPELIRRIEQAGGLARNLSAKLAGGANMFATTRLNVIGEQNQAKVEQLLQAAGIPVVARHCGGQQGRRMFYDVESGTVTVEIVGGRPVTM